MDTKQMQTVLAQANDLLKEGHYDEALEVLNTLDEESELGGVISYMKGCAFLQMEQDEQAHLCFGDTGTSKGQTIRTLMEKYQIENCAYIGDTQGDYEATVEAGVPFIFCAYGFGNPQGWTAKIEKIEDLLTLDI